MRVTLLDFGNSMWVETRIFHGLEEVNLALLYHFARRFIISGCFAKNNSTISPCRCDAPLALQVGVHEYTIQIL